MNSTNIRNIVLTSFLLMVSQLLLGCSDQSSEATEEQESTLLQPSLTVLTAAPKVEEWDESVTVNGIIEAWQYGTVSTEVGGLKLTKLYADVGDLVSKGQLLAEFDQQQVNIDYAIAKANLDSAEAELAFSTSVAERTDSLISTGTLSNEEIQKNQTDKNKAKASFDVAKSQLDLQIFRLERSKIVAQEDAIISERMAEIGKVYSVGEAMFRTIRQAKLEWRANVPERQLAFIEVGQSAKVMLPDGNVINGVVRQISPVVDQDTLTAVVYVALGETSKLKAGSFSQGRIHIGLSRALTVPESSIIYSDGFSYVYTVDSQHIVSRIKVKTGRRNNGRVEVVDGLLADANIIVDGSAFLVPGDKVTVVDNNVEHAVNVGEEL
jgi:RND family efflux transporter MFP subunit